MLGVNRKIDRVLISTKSEAQGREKKIEVELVKERKNYKFSILENAATANLHDSRRKADLHKERAQKAWEYSRDLGRINIACIALAVVGMYISNFGSDSDKKELSVSQQRYATHSLTTVVVLLMGSVCAGVCSIIEKRKSHEQENNVTFWNVVLKKQPFFSGVQHPRDFDSKFLES